MILHTKYNFSQCTRLRAEFSSRTGRESWRRCWASECVCLGLVLRLQRKAKVWGTLWPEIDILCRPAPPPKPPAPWPTIRRQHQQHIDNNSNNKIREEKKTEKNWLQALSLSFTGDNGWLKGGRGVTKRGWPKGKHTQSSTNSHNK